MPGATSEQRFDTQYTVYQRPVPIGTSNGLIRIVGEPGWPPDATDGELIDRLVVWIADLPDLGGE
jgi:hypothetical protein